MKKVWLLIHGWYEVDKVEVFATFEGAETEHQRLLDEQHKEALAYMDTFNREAVNWMTRDNWTVEETELRD